MHSTELLEKNGRDGLSVEGALGEETVPIEISGSIADDLPSQRHIFHAHVPESLPVLVERSEEQMVATSTAEDPPPQRHGVYAHVPESIPFSPRPSDIEIAVFQAQKSPGRQQVHTRPSIIQEWSMVKSTLHSAGTKTLELLIEAADCEVNFTTGYSVDVVLNNTVSGFFSFYAAVSETPIEECQKPRFIPCWSSYSSTCTATTQMGEPAWRILKKVIQAWYKQVEKAEPKEMGVPDHDTEGIE